MTASYIFRKFLLDLGLNPDSFTLYKILLAIVIFFIPIFWNVVGILALISLDFITGLIAAYKNKTPITSRRASRSIYKTLVYVILLCAGLIADRLIDWKIFVNFITYFLTIVEIFSVGENFQKITGLSFVSYLKKYIESKMKIADVFEPEKKEPE